jgi:hypothetical protein
LAILRGGGAARDDQSKGRRCGCVATHDTLHPASRRSYPEAKDQTVTLAAIAAGKTPPETKRAGARPALPSSIPGGIRT